jgi:hypothetical protein
VSNENRKFQKPNYESFATAIPASPKRVLIRNAGEACSQVSVARSKTVSR